MLKTFRVGPLEANCYVLTDDSTKETAVIDPGGAPDAIFNYINNSNLIPKYIICTHGHYDHIGGVPTFKKKLKADLLVNKCDEDMLVNPKKYIPFIGVFVQGGMKPDNYISDGDILKLGEIKLKVLHTPGHTPGGISLYVKDLKVVFTGDTLFCDGVGRTDLVNGSFEDLSKSIKDKLFNLPADTIVYPGHGPETTVGHEKSNNPYVCDAI